MCAKPFSMSTYSSWNWPYSKFVHLQQNPTLQVGQRQSWPILWIPKAYGIVWKILNFISKAFKRVKLIFLSKNCFNIVQHGHLEKECLQIKCLTWQQSKHNVPVFTHFVKHTKCGLEDSQMNMEIFLCLISICSPKLWVHRLLQNVGVIH
jgi:hypothetical protein